MAAGQPVDRSELLATVLLSLEKAYVEAVANVGFERALREFRDRDYLLNRSVSVQTREGPVVGAAPRASTSTARFWSSCRTATCAASTPAT